MEKATKIEIPQKEWQMLANILSKYMNEQNKRLDIMGEMLARIKEQLEQIEKNTRDATRVNL